MSADIDGIRKRHAEYDRVPRATGFNSSVDQAHADRAALLAALDAHLAREEAAQARSHGKEAMIVSLQADLADSQAELDRLARALDEANNRVAHVESDLFESRQVLDRLAAVTVEEVAQAPVGAAGVSVDLDAIRARHALGEQINLSWPQAMARQAHADRAALLAEVDAVTAILADGGVQTRDIAVGVSLVVRERAQYSRDLHAAQAALDRLAALTEEEVAQAIAKTPGPHPSGVGTVWHGVPWATANQVTYRAMAAAVLALLHARLDGPCPRTRPA